jgi:hypothetical protein
MTQCRCLLAAWLFNLVAASCLAQTPGLQELVRLDQLPVLKTARIAAVSSYDRTGGNDDGFSGKYSFVRKEPEGLVLADLKGPGVIHRIWTPTPTDDVLEFLFDGESTPRLSLKMRELFLGKHPLFPAPLSGFGAGGYYCYAPLPYARSCIVRLRAQKMQFYQINYATFDDAAGVRTFEPSTAGPEAALRDRAARVWGMSGQDLTAFTAPVGATVERRARSVSLRPNSTETVFSDQAGGRIVGLKLSPASAIAGKARDLLLKISFDDGEPSVLCPLGDFFGYAWGQPAMQSLLLGTVGETDYCYLPMPFERSARVDLVSERSTIADVSVEVAWCAEPRRPDEGQFYALWRRENPTRIGEPYTFVETAGRGHLVGVILQAQGFESGKTLFFEGDDQTTVDGQLVIHGTGSEDFFNGGWYDVPDRWEKRMSFPLSGCLGYAKHLGRTGAYRFFVGDAYRFQKSLKQTIEHAGEKNSIPTDYCSVSFLYAARRPSASLTPPPPAERAVHDLDEVLFPAWWQLPIAAWSFDQASLTRRKEKIGGEEVKFLSLAATGQDWFGPHFLSPTCEVPASGRYSIYLEVVKGPGQGTVQLFQNENPAGDPVDLYAEQMTRSGRLFVGRLLLAEGRNNLMIKLVGKNEKASGLGLDLVSISCVRQP